ncbi:signal peptidase I [Sphingomonas floccifaciens]
MTDTISAPDTRSTWRAELRGILMLALAVIGFHSLIARPFYIASGSMMPELLTGDRLVVSKYPYGWSYASVSFDVLPALRGRLFGRLPTRGDIVILTPPDPARRSETLIKRVIGLPGDTVQMVRGRLWLNGRPVATEDRGLQRIVDNGNAPCPGEVTDGICRVHMMRETLPNGASYTTMDLGQSRLDDTVAYRVPAGHIYVMGDNRDNSADSRVATDEGGLGGAVPVESIGGRAEFATFSLNGNATWNPLGWLAGFRWDRTGDSLRPVIRS